MYTLLECNIKSFGEVAPGKPTLFKRMGDIQGFVFIKVGPGGGREGVHFALHHCSARSHVCVCVYLCVCVCLCAHVLYTERERKREVEQESEGDGGEWEIERETEKKCEIL